MYTNHQSLHAYLFYIFPNLITRLIFCACSMLVNVCENRWKTTFVTYIVLCFILVLNKPISVFVDSIVGQMHAKIVEVGTHWTMILFSCKSCKSFFVDETSEWWDSSYKNIDPKVKFEAINQIRFVQISLSYIVFTLNHPIAISC